MGEKMKFSKLIPIVFLFMASCSAPVTSVPTPTLMPEPTATQTLIPTPTEIQTNTPLPDRFAGLTNIPKNKEQITKCPLIASPWEEEKWKQDIYQALYTGARLQTLNDWKGYTIEIPSPIGAISANSEQMYLESGSMVDPAACFRFKDDKNKDAVLLALPAVHNGDRFYILAAPNPDTDPKWDNEIFKSTVENLLGGLPLKVNNVSIFYSAVQTNENLKVNNTKFLESILSLPSQQGTGEELTKCIVSDQAHADIAKLACNELIDRVFIWGNAQ
jgi:hypothetical protein